VVDCDVSQVYEVPIYTRMSVIYEALRFFVPYIMKHIRCSYWSIEIATFYNTNNTNEYIERIL